MEPELLLIDPDPDVADAVRRVFSVAGFQVTNLTAGEPAVDRCRASRPALVLLSAELPDMSGFSVCNRIKRAIASVPLILYTGDDGDAAVAAHRQTRTPADEYCRRPLDYAALLARAAQLVGTEVPAGIDVAQALAARSAAAPSPVAVETGGPEPAHAVPPALPTPARAESTSAVEELLPEWPRDPSPPRGAPEEKLEFFRERLRVKDTFLARVKEAMTAQRQDVIELRERIDLLRRQHADAERARLDVERLLGESRTASEELEARRADLERRLAESETTRQALSDVLSETMQHAETTEREWAQRLTQVEEARAQLETAAAADRSAATAALESERQARARAESEREADRAALDAQLASLREERDAVGRDVARLHAQLDHQTAAHEEQRATSGAALAAVSADRDDAQRRAEVVARERDEARQNAQAVAAELGQARARVDALTTEVAQAQGRNDSLSVELTQVRGRAEALEATLAEARSRSEALAVEAQRAAEERRAVADQLESARGDAERLQREVAQVAEMLQSVREQLEDTSRAAAEAAADRDRIQQQAAAEIQSRASDVARLETEVAAGRRRISELESERAAREGQVARTLADAEAQRRAASDEAGEAERRHAAEIQRQKGALVDLERRLEASARAEGQARRRIGELEKERAERIAQAERLAAAEETLLRTREELDDLRTENDFLNGEVARYHQKNRDLVAQLGKS